MLHTDIHLYINMYMLHINIEININMGIGIGIGIGIDIGTLKMSFIVYACAVEVIARPNRIEVRRKSPASSHACARTERHVADGKRIGIEIGIEIGVEIGIEIGVR